MKEFIKSSYRNVLTILAILGIGSIALSYLLKTSLVIFSITSLVGAIGTYAFARSEMEESEVGKNFMLLVASLFSGVFGIVHQVIYSSVYKGIMKLASTDMSGLGGMYENMAGTAFFLSAILNIFVVFAVVIYARDESRKETLLSLKDMSIDKLKGSSDEEASTEVPDIVLCKDADTGKNVIWPHHDRYVHALILGPTGSGKTSQSIIPMIYQDMQKDNIGITVLEPKGDLAEKVWAMAKYFDKPIIYFNPMLKNCPYFNPLFGKEEDVIENMTTSFKMLAPDSSQFFLDQNENLLRNALKVLKRLEKTNPSKYAANFITLSRFVQDINGEGRQMVIEFSRIVCEEEIMKENADIAAYFLNDYFTGASGSSGRGTKTYEHTSGVRTQIQKLISNKYLRKVLNPPPMVNDIDFEEHLAKGGVIAMATAQGDLRELGKTLGLFLILQFQAGVFRRPAPEKSRMPHMFYIDEFQEFANPSMGILLTQGRSYRVGCHLATQAREQIALGPDGRSFLSLVSANARSVIVYPGIESNDAEYFSRQFGEIEEEVEKEVRTKKPFDPFKGSFSYDRDVTIRTEKLKKTRFSPSDIRFRPFKEITYCIVSKNTLQPPGVGKIEFIPKDVNDELDDMIEKFREENMLGPGSSNSLNVNNNSFVNTVENNKSMYYDNNDTEMSKNVINTDITSNTNMDIGIDIDIDDIFSNNSIEGIENTIYDLEEDKFESPKNEPSGPPVEESIVFDDEDIQFNSGIDFLG